MIDIIDQKAISLTKIAETGSFTKAADLLCLTQPTVSNHIKLLEDEIGQELIDRNQNKVRLTPYGEVAVKLCKKNDEFSFEHGAISQRL